jgi:hypothetical protein
MRGKGGAVNYADVLDISADIANVVVPASLGTASSTAEQALHLPVRLSIRRSTRCLENVRSHQ